MRNIVIIWFSSMGTGSRTVITINSMERSTIKEMLVIILMVIGSML